MRVHHQVQALKQHTFVGVRVAQVLNRQHDFFCNKLEVVARRPAVKLPVAAKRIRFLHPSTR